MGLLQKIFGGGRSEAKAVAPERMVEDYLRALKGTKSQVRELSELPHDKDAIRDALRAGMVAANGREDWAEFDRLRAGFLRLADFQDSAACEANEQAPETVMIAEVRMAMTEIEDMLGGLKELNGMWSGDRTDA